MSLKLIFQFLVLTGVISGVLIFFLKKVLFDSTQGAVNRLNRETEDVRKKQAELNEKIKQANEELTTRRQEADELVTKMKENAHEKAMEEREKIITKARADAEEIINKAQQTKADMRKVVEQETEMKQIDYAAMILHDILEEKALLTLNDALTDDFLNSLESVDMEMISKDVNEAEVVSIAKLDDRHLKKFQEILDKKLGRPIKISLSEDRKMIGGVVLKFGSLALDGSLAHMVLEKGTELKELKEKGLI